MSCDAHQRLAWHAGIQPNDRVLDWCAGMGQTCEAILPSLSSEGRIVAFEPFAAMHSAGEARVRDPRVRWVRHLPSGPFDRILYNGAIGNTLPLPEGVLPLAAQLREGGSLTLHIPPPLSAATAEPAASQVLRETGLDVVSWRFRRWLPDTQPQTWEWWSGLTASRNPGTRGALRCHQPFADSSNLLDDTAALCHRAGTDGYLFFRSLIDTPEVETVSRPVEQLFRSLPDLPHNVKFLGLQRQVTLMDETRALLQSEPILQILRKIIGCDLDRAFGFVSRIVPPGADATPPHQDQYFIHNWKNAWTVWMPLQDCPLSLGPLAVAPGSLHEGLRAHPNNWITDLDDSVCWATGPMRAGDVLMFHGRTIHCACPNLTADRTRFSIDCRYALQRDRAPR